MRTFLDTNILVHAHNRSSSRQAEAAEILRRALRRDVEALISPQVLYEFYAVITDPKRVERPLPPSEASDICLDVWECKEIDKVSPTPTAPVEVMILAEGMGLRGGSIFDCVLAVTAKENGAEAIFTENKQDFEGFGFLKAYNPFTESLRKP